MRRRCARCITQESRGAIRSRVLFRRRIPTAVNQATCHLPEYVMYRINIRAGAHTPARTRAPTRGAGAKFFPPPSNGESPVPATRILSRLSLCLFPLSLSLSLFLVRSSPKTAIPHLSLHLLDPRRLKRKLVRSRPDGTRTGMSVHFFFFSFFFVTLTVYACHDTGRNKIFWYFPGKVRLKLYIPVSSCDATGWLNCN